MKLTLIRGIPGSGKSTLALKILNAQDTYTGSNVRHLEADMYFITNGLYKFDPEKLKEAHAWCFDQTKQGLQQGKHIIVSNTFIKSWEIQPYIQLAKKTGAFLEIHEATGSFQNIHGVPEQTIDRMKSDWEALSELPYDV